MSVWHGWGHSEDSISLHCVQIYDTPEQEMHYKWYHTEQFYLPLLF